MFKQLPEQLHVAVRRFLPRAALLSGLLMGEGRETGLSSRAQKKDHENETTKETKFRAQEPA
jgi:hypothetical protein